MNNETKSAIEALAERFVSATLIAVGGATEGVVMGAAATDGHAPYRRLDCDGRALAYVRARAKKRLVRVDISGLWTAPTDVGRACSPLFVPAATGISIAIRSDADLKEAVVFMHAVVETTRAAKRDPAREEARPISRDVRHG